MKLTLSGGISATPIVMLATSQKNTTFTKSKEKLRMVTLNIQTHSHTGLQLKRDMN
jgi:hypothetical protein